MKRLLFLTGGVLGLSIFSFALSPNFGVTKVASAYYKIENPNSISSSDMQTLKSDIMNIYGIDGSKSQYDLDLIHLPGQQDFGGVHHILGNVEILDYAVLPDDYMPTPGGPSYPYLKEMSQILATYSATN